MTDADRKTIIFLGERAMGWKYAPESTEASEDRMPRFRAEDGSLICDWNPLENRDSAMRLFEKLGSEAWEIVIESRPTWVPLTEVVSLAVPKLKFLVTMRRYSTQLGQGSADCWRRALVEAARQALERIYDVA